MSLPLLLAVLAVLIVVAESCDLHQELTPTHLRRTANCDQYLPTEERHRVHQAIADNPVMLFAWAGCPCTNMARTRFARSDVCFRKDVWWNADNALMPYLQCLHHEGGRAHHSFIFFKGVFYGDGFLFADGRLSDEQLHKLVDDTGAERTCTGGGIDRKKALELCLLPDTPETAMCFSDLTSATATTTTHQTCCKLTHDELIEEAQAGNPIDQPALRAKTTFCNNFYSSASSDAGSALDGRMQQLASNYCQCERAASGGCLRDGDGLIVFQKDRQFSQSYMWCTSEGSNVCASKKGEGAAVVFARQPLEDERVNSCEFCSSACKARHGVWSHYTPGHNGECGTGFSSECGGQCCESKFGWSMDNFCEEHTPNQEDNDLYSSGDMGEDAGTFREPGASPDTSTVEPGPVTATVTGSMLLSGLSEEDWDSDSTIADALIGSISSLLDFPESRIEILSASSRGSSRRRVVQSWRRQGRQLAPLELQIDYRLELDAAQSADAISKALVSGVDTPGFIEQFVDLAVKLTPESKLKGLELAITIASEPIARSMDGTPLPGEGQEPDTQPSGASPGAEYGDTDSVARVSDGSATVDRAQGDHAQRAEMQIETENADTGVLATVAKGAIGSLGLLLVCAVAFVLVNRSRRRSDTGVPHVVEGAFEHEGSDRTNALSLGD